MIRGLLCDVHGVLYTYPRALPRSVDAVRRLQRKNMPHLFLTNSTQHGKAWTLRSLNDLGFRVGPESVLTAAEAAADRLAREGKHRVGWLCVDELLEDMPGVEPVRPGEPGPVDAVVVGDLGDGFTASVLNAAFRWLVEGAPLLALARARFYENARGELVLDCGPYVRLLEDAAGIRAEVAGKPSPAFFRAGLRRLGLEVSETAMVGDDLDCDVLPAMDLGMRGFLVRTGKFREDRYRRAPRKADRVVADLWEAVDALVRGEEGDPGPGKAIDPTGEAPL